jgi:hypothetical protein
MVALPTLLLETNPCATTIDPHQPRAGTLEWSNLVPFLVQPTGAKRSSFHRCTACQSSISFKGQRERKIGIIRAKEVVP